MKIGPGRLTAALVFAATPVLAHGGHCGGGAPEADLPTLFAQADADGNGRLTPEEFKTFQQLVAQKRTELRFKRLDANGDGAVTLDEINALAAQRHADQRPHGRRPRSG